MVIQKLKSGNYFKKVDVDGTHKYVIDYCCWAEQTVIWCGVVLLVAKNTNPKMKIIVTSAIVILNAQVQSLGNDSMKLFGDNNKLKESFVVFIVPVVVNVIQVTSQAQP